MVNFANYYQFNNKINIPPRDYMNTSLLYLTNNAVFHNINYAKIGTLFVEIQHDDKEA